MTEKLINGSREVVMEGRNLTKTFGGLVAVNDVTFQLYRGEILGLIGPNGAGKTTLFNMIAGAIPVNGGRIFFEGQEIKKPSADRMCQLGVGRTYQICQPFGAMTVRYNVMVGAFIHYPKMKDAAKKADDVLKKVGLYHRADTLGSELTLPELKRMEVARALATEPEVLLLDEVIAGLNPTEVDKFVKLIETIHRQEKLTIIIIEHVMRALMSLSDRIVVLNQGAKIADGLPAEVAKNPQVIDSYLGTEVVHVKTE
jgi:branched-chain amino acid transport system ATP-binding protein